MSAMYMAESRPEDPTMTEHCGGLPLLHPSGSKTGL